MKKIVSLMLILAFALLAGCASAAEPAKEAKSLSAEELSDYNKKFEMVKDGKTNALCCFLMSDYEKIEDMDLSAFLYNFPDGVSVDGEEEFNALKELEGWQFGDVTLDQMPVPIHKFSRAAVDEILEKYGNTSSDKLTNGRDTVLYLEEYDSFYNFTSDFALNGFECVSGESDGDVVTLRSESDVLKITHSESGNIVFLSHETDKAAENS